MLIILFACPDTLPPIIKPTAYAGYALFHVGDALFHAGDVLFFAGFAPLSNAEDKGIRRSCSSAAFDSHFPACMAVAASACEEAAGTAAATASSSAAGLGAWPNLAFDGTARWVEVSSPTTSSRITDATTSTLPLPIIFIISIQTPDRQTWSVAQKALRLAGSFVYRNPECTVPSQAVAREPLR
jgi:hypothetical protein